jgi:hypothetical protein
MIPKVNPADSVYLVTPPAFNAPRHQTHIFVEHTNGLFVPSAVHEQLNTQFESQRNLQSTSGTDQSSYWNFTDDAKDYAAFVDDVMHFFKKLADLISGFACGFCIFLIISCYSSYSSTFFFELYGNFFTLVEKWFLAMSLVLVILNLYPMAFELSRINRRRSFGGGTIGASDDPSNGNNNLSPGVSGQRSIGATAAGLQQQPEQQRWQALEATRMFARRAVSLLTDNVMLRMLLGESTSPFRHLVQLRFFCYAGCLGCTIVEMSISQGKSSKTIQELSSASASRLHGAILARCVLFTLAWFMGLRS